MTAPLPNLRAGDTDAKIRSKVGPKFVTTRRPTTAAVTTQAGPKFATKALPTGASSGDHTHAALGFKPTQISYRLSKLVEAGQLVKQHAVRVTLGTGGREISRDLSGPVLYRLPG